MQTTVGQLLINSELPEHLRDYNRVLDKKGVADLLEKVAQENNPALYRQVVHSLHQIGQLSAQTFGSSFSLKDFLTPPKTKQMVDQLKMKINEVVERQDLTDEQKDSALKAMTLQAAPILEDTLVDELKASGNPFGTQLISGARGGKGDVRSLMIGDLLVSDHKQRPIPIPITTSMATGYSPADYWASSYGARYGTLGVKLCLAEGTQVLCGVDGTSKAIETLKPGDTVYTLDADDKLITTKVTATMYVGERICDAFEFGNGASATTFVVEATPEHKVLLEYRDKSNCLKRGMRELMYARDKRSGAVLPKGMVDVDMVTEPRALLLGALIGDGGLTGRSTKFWLNDTLFIESLREDAALLGLELRLSTVRDTVDEYILTEIVKSAGIGGGHKTPFRTWLKTIGMLGKYSYEKTLPDIVNTWDAKSIGRLLAGMWSTDGCTTTTSNKYGSSYPIFSYYCTSRKLVEQLRSLLFYRLGVYTTTIRIRAVKGDLSVFPDGHSSVRNHNLYGTCISDVASLSRLLAVCPDVSQKIVRMREMVGQPRKRAPNMMARYRRSVTVGVRKVYDIEVAHESHRFVLANGITVSNSTQRAGFLGKQLIQAAHKQVVTAHDCGTDQSIPVAADDKDNVGAVLAKDVGEFKSGTVIDPKIHKLIADQNPDKKVYVRSALTCEATNGVCAKCAGIRERGTFPEIGDNLGVASAQALAERVSQNSLGTKHGGGRAKSDVSNIPTGFKLINQLVQVPKSFTGAAAVSKLDGVVREVREAPQGGTHIMIGDVEHYVPVGLNALVKPGTRVEQGDLLSEGIPNPAELVEHRGLGAGRLDFVNVFRKAFKDSGMTANRRNIEVLTRGLINHVHVTESDGVDNALPDDLVEYSSIARNYRPRYGFKVARPAALVGHYLERPVNQYSIGTRITRRVADDLGKAGVEQVTAHAEPAPFHPKMVRAMEQALVSPDWQTRLGGSYMERGLLDSLHKGVPSAEHSTSYIPALAKGVGFGEKLKTEGVY